MNTSTEERQKIIELSIEGVFKSTLSSIPIVGMILTDVLFDYRNKLKQERLNEFIESLKSYFENANPEIDLKNMQSDGFSDLFETILIKVSRTRAKEKLEGFKNLLLNGIKSNDNVDYCEVFSDILFELNSNDIFILTKHESFLYEGVGLFKKRDELQSELSNFEQSEIYLTAQQSSIPQSPFMARRRSKSDMQDDIARVKKMILDYKNEVTHENFGLSDGQFSYCIQKLYNKGLLFDEGVGAIGTRPFTIMRITDFGRDFLRFIRYQ